MKLVKTKCFKLGGGSEKYFKIFLLTTTIMNRIIFAFIYTSEYRLK